jgi:hypothetical protein
MRGPGGWSLGASSRRDTANLRDRAIAVPGGGYCTCGPAPFCQGPLSSDWADCDARCKPCRVPAPRPVVGDDPSLADG